MSTPVFTTPDACRYGVAWCTAGQVEHEPCASSPVHMTAPGHPTPVNILELNIEDYGNGPRLTLVPAGRDAVTVTPEQVDDLRGQLLDHVIALARMNDRYKALTRPVVEEAAELDPAAAAPPVDNTTCVRCDADVEFAPADRPAFGMAGRRVCATEDGRIGEIACGLSDVQIAIHRTILQAGQSKSPDQEAEWTAARTAAVPLLDQVADGLAAFLVHDEGAWVAIANYALSKLAERAKLPGGAP